MNREFGEGLKLFLRVGSNCESVIWERRERKRRRRTICKIEE
jgi:hypothetical protein